MKSVYILMLPLLFVSFIANAQSTEVFEDESAGATSFTDNGTTFNITSSEGFAVLELAGAGWNGTTVDNKFIDNTIGVNTSPAGASFTIRQNANQDFLVTDLYLFCSRINLTNHTGTLTITGRKNNSNVYSFTKSSGFSNTETFSPNNGFTYIDFATEGMSDYTDDPIDELVFSSTGNLDYMALDAFQWNNIILPVELTKFSGTSRNKNVHLSWETASEANNEGFQIEHSVDGIEWKNIGFKKGNGSTDLFSQYEFTHDSPTLESNYYRLKQLDFDGKFEYSAIINVSITADQEISISPNPTNGVIRLNKFSEGEIKIYDASGRILKELKISDQEINLSDLPNGILFIQVITKTQNTVKRILKE